MLVDCSNCGTRYPPDSPACPHCKTRRLTMAKSTVHNGPSNIDANPVDIVYPAADDEALGAAAAADDLDADIQAAIAAASDADLGFEDLVERPGLNGTIRAWEGYVTSLGGVLTVGGVYSRAELIELADELESDDVFAGDHDNPEPDEVDEDDIQL